MPEGGCFCGAVRYKIEGALGRASACHCSRCRKAFSGASSAYAEIPEGSAFSWVRGEDKLARFSFSKGWALAFCRICGSTLCGIVDSNVHGVTLGTVDGDPGVQIERHTFVGSKAPWDHIGGSAPQFAAEYPDVDTADTRPMTPRE
ncbi:MAG TPA: GFA family protein [Polyangiaceae bacterium]|nr:GFA family protein [Polyangiaceae bacterium]